MNMPLESYKSVVYNRKNKLEDESDVLYDKAFFYDEVKDKLKHNLTVMPKDQIDGRVYIWKFQKNKPSMLLISMDEKFQDWKHRYDSFVQNFTADSYIYYITTIDAERGKHYRTIIALIPKNKPFSSIIKMLNYTNIESFVKNAFIEKIKEKR